MPEVEPEDVRDLLDATIKNPGAVVPIITTMAKAYTRGRGFTGNVPNAEIAAVITTAAARLASNTNQWSMSQTLGSMTSDHRSFFTGWSLAEQFVLNRYRVRAI